MTKTKKKPNYFRIHSEKLNKLFWWLFSALLGLNAIMFLICMFGLFCQKISLPGMDLASDLGLEYVVKGYFVIDLVLFTAFAVVVIYNYATNKEKYEEERESAKAESPLTESAKSHEQQIVDLMSSIIKPVPGKKTINQAKTAKFIKALSDLELIDSNLDTKHLMAWIECVTGYPSCETRVFNQALKAVKVNDPDLLNYKSQLEQILAQ